MKFFWEACLGRAVQNSNRLSPIAIHQSGRLQWLIAHRSSLIVHPSFSGIGRIRRAGIHPSNRQSPLINPMGCSGDWLRRN